MEIRIQNVNMTNMTPRTQVPILIALCGVSIWFSWHPLVTTFRLALANDAYTHILLIIPLSAALIYMEHGYAHTKSLPLDARPNPLPAAVLLVVALLLACYARWGPLGSSDDLGLSLGMFALVTWCVASVWLCFGATTLHSFLFPLCILFLVVPIPDFVLSRIVEFLQHQSAFTARLMFRAVGVPATQDGIIVSIPGLDIEVARECSSIRSSILLVVTTMALAHLFLRSWWRKALLIAAAIPLAVAKNGLRIFTIAELGTRVDRGFLDGKLHHNGGVLFLGVAVVAVSVLLWALRRTELPLSSGHRL
jgi:exosortase